MLLSQALKPDNRIKPLTIDFVFKMLESFYDKENFSYLSNKSNNTNKHEQIKQRNRVLYPKTQGLIDSLKDLSLVGNEKDDMKMKPSRRYDSTCPFIWAPFKNFQKAL